MSRKDSNSAEGPSFGLLLVAIGITALYLARLIDSPAIVDENEPSPAMLPSALAVLLLAGGILLTGVWVRESGWAATKGWCREIPGRTALAFQGSARMNVLLTFVSLSFYVIAIQWLGFSISTFLFATALMRRLGSRLWLAIFVSSFAVLTIRLVFGVAFDVYLPEGFLENIQSDSQLS